MDHLFVLLSVAAPVKCSRRHVRVTQIGHCEPVLLRRVLSAKSEGSMLCDDAAYTRVRVCNVDVRSIVTLSSMSLSWGGDDEKPFSRPIRPCLVCPLVVQQAVAAIAAMPTHLECNVLRNGEPAGQHGFQECGRQPTSPDFDKRSRQNGLHYVCRFEHSSLERWSKGSGSCR